MIAIGPFPLEVALARIPSSICEYHNLYYYTWAARSDDFHEGCAKLMEPL
jgi:hypothetical protein